MSRAKRDTVVIVAIATAVWLLIEGTETCDRVFDWIADNPQYGVDSMILAFILMSVGITIAALRRFQDMRGAMAAQQAAEERAHALAFHDPLTGLPNRRALNDLLEAEVRRPGNDFGLLVIDLDRFKGVNDVHGHPAGDRLLRAVARRLEQLLEKDCHVFRLGGDEFAMVCKGPASHERARRAARRIVSAVAHPFELNGLVHHIGSSIGIAMFPSDAMGRETLLRRADIALYRAKDAGRSQHRSFEPAMDAEITHRANIEQSLRVAIDKNLLRPHYQPLVDLESGRIVGFEMLARWRQEDGSWVEPELFVSIAEESGLINAMMMQLLERACEDARHWDPELTIAVNISPVQLKDPFLSEKVLSTLTRCGFPSQRLAIEITENALITDAECAERTIQSFQNQGMKIGLDDFGTGYSSLHHLRALRFDKIKIDRSFVQAIETDPEAMKIVRAITSLASSLDLPVIAEGVENAAIGALLHKMGCAQAQGYHYGRAMPGEAVTKLLAATEALATPVLQVA